MMILTIAATVLSLTTLLSLYRRHRPRPMVHHVIMAEYFWQPRKLK
jgi:uncharacterized membrane protein